MHPPPRVQRRLHSVRDSHPDIQSSVSELDFVCEQSQTTQETVSSVSELQQPKE